MTNTTNPYISIIISCYRPSKKAIVNSRIIGEIAKEISNEIEVIYLFNGLDEPKAGTINAISDNLSAYGNCIIMSCSENIGVGPAYQKLCEKATGKYIYCLTDDDLLSLNNVKNTLNFLKQNKDIFIVHQLVNDPSYEESHLFCGVHEKSSRCYNTAFAYICFRYGCLPGSIFLRSLYSEKLRDWEGKIYPWPEIAFDAYGENIALFDPIERITIDKGVPAHERFNDRVTRGYDYGFNERFAHRLGSKMEVKAVYAYLLINWMARITLRINKVDKKLAKKVVCNLRGANDRRLVGFYYLFRFRLAFLSTLESLVGFWFWRSKR